MSDKEAGMPAQSSSKAAAKDDAAAAAATVGAAPAVSTVDGPPERSGEDLRREWADANGVDPSDMHEIRYPGGWVDRFDGNGWVQEGGY